MTPVEMQESLRELGIESKMVTYPNKRATGLEWQVNGIVWTYGWYGERPQALRTYMHYSHEQAIAATVGEKYEMHICKRCGVAYELNIIDEGFGKSRFCPNCGYRELYQ